MKLLRLRGIPPSLFCSFALLLFCSPAFGQGCAMCKKALGSQLASVIHSFNLGILVLVFPPLLMMGAILWMAFQRRD